MIIRRLTSGMLPFCFLDEASHVLNRSVRSNYIKKSAPNDAHKPAPPMIASPMKKRTSMAASVQK